MCNRPIKSTSRGFTLVEMMIGLLLLVILMGGVFSSVITSSRLAESNIFYTQALLSARGYLEQIRSLPYDDIIAATSDPSVGNLATIAPSYDAVTGITITNEPLSIDPGNQPQTRDVLIDARQDGAGPLIMMPMRLYVTVNDLNTGNSPIPAVEVIIRYEYKSPQMKEDDWLEGQLQVIRARI